MPLKILDDSNSRAIPDSCCKEPMSRVRGGGWFAAIVVGGQKKKRRPATSDEKTVKGLGELSYLLKLKLSTTSVVRIREQTRGEQAPDGGSVHVDGIW